MRLTTTTLPMATFALTLALAGCSTNDPTASPAVLFTPTGSSDGPRLWLDAERAGGDIELRLWGADLGAVLGWSAHLAYDGQALAIDAARIDEMVLGGAQAAIVLAAPKPGDVSLGAVRRGVALDGVVIDDVTKLATMTARAEARNRAHLELLQVIVRRADASFVAVDAIGGELDASGGAQ